MTPEAALIELLERVGAGRGASVLVSDHELSRWPSAAVAATKVHGLLTKARPAASAVCPGCERECIMPVYTLPSTTRAPESFIVCDKRSDINRVPVSTDRLEQWQASGESLADLLARLLDLNRPGSRNDNTRRWEVGLLRGVKHAGHLVLVADDGFRLTLSGHSVPLTDVLTLDGNRLAVDRRALLRLVDHPVAGAGDTESAEQRRERLKARVRKEQAKGTKAFLRAVAEEEGISISRLKQLTSAKPEIWPNAATVQKRT